MQSSSVREPGRDVHDVQIATLDMDVLILDLTRMKVAVLGLPSLDFHAFSTGRQTMWSFALLKMQSLLIGEYKCHTPREKLSSNGTVSYPNTYCFVISKGTFFC